MNRTKQSTQRESFATLGNTTSMGYQDPQSPTMQSRFERARSPDQSNSLGSFHELRVPNPRLQPFPSPSLALEEFGLNLLLPSPPASPPLSAYEGEEFDDELGLTRTITAIYNPINNDASTPVQSPSQKYPPAPLFVPPSSPPGQEDSSTSQCSTPRPYLGLNMSMPQSPRQTESAIARRGAIYALCMSDSDVGSRRIVSPQLWTAELADRTKLPQATVTPLLQGVSKDVTGNALMMSPVHDPGDSMPNVARVGVTSDG